MTEMSGPRSTRLARVWPWAGLAARLTVGGVWLTSGALKLPDPAETVRAVRAYQLLPEAVVPLVGYGLPVLEVAIGLLLVLGVAVRLSAIVSAVLLVAFLVGIGAAWARGLQIDCGCFSPGGEVAAGDTRYPQEMARDTALLVLAVLLARWPRTHLALGPRLVGGSDAGGPDKSTADEAAPHEPALEDSRRSRP